MQEMIRRCEGETKVEESKVVETQEAFKEWIRLKDEALEHK